MWLSDVSVQRPVLAAVVSLLLVAFGLLSFRYLPLRELPDMSPPVVSVATNYRGASAGIVETRVTQIIEDQISGLEGIESITSFSRDEASRVNIRFSTERDIDQAANDVRDRVSRITARLPEDAESPRVRKRDSDARPVMSLTLSSDRMTLMELDDYARRYLVDRLSVVPGIAAVNVDGGGRPSMRIWVDRLALAARGLTVAEIEAALRSENLELPAGRIEAEKREVRVRLVRNYSTVEDFRKLVIGSGENGQLIRLGDVAVVAIAPENLRSSFRVNDKATVGLSIFKQSTANTLETLEDVKDKLTRIDESLPAHMDLVPSSDDSLFIREAVNSVYQTIIITTGLVSLVILVFLGSFRAMLIPAVTIPISLVATFIVLGAFGFSVNLITLLALVLAIGLVVDDAIVVLENIHRRVEQGEPPLLAAFHGSRQVAFAVLATTVVLVAVFTPVLFLDHQMGIIFGELAVTIGAAVIFSTVVALSLTPALCSKVLRKRTSSGRAQRGVDAVFASAEGVYRRWLRRLLGASWLAIPATLLTVGACYWLLMSLPDEYAPTQDRGVFYASVLAPEGTSIARMREAMADLEVPLTQMREEGVIERSMVYVPGWHGGDPNNGVIIATLTPWQQRSVSSEEAAQRASEAWRSIPFVRAFATSRSGVSFGNGGAPIQFVVGGPSYELLADWRDILLDRAEDYPGISRIDSDLKETQPQLLVRIDKNRAAALGVTVQTVGKTLAAMMSERRVTTFIQDGEEYEVILQAREDQRASAQSLQNIYVRSDISGRLISLANLIYLEESAGAARLNRYNRLRSVTFSGNLEKGYALGDALRFLEETVRQELPESAQVDYKGESLEYKQASGALVFTAGMVLLVVFLVLAAQFESFVLPFVIMLTVPLAMSGALLGLYVTDSSLNLYSQIGSILLIGIAAKNGVLIVEFVNQLRDAGREFEDAIVDAAIVRLRPVILTTFSTALGAIPLMLVTGAGAEGRNILGIVIFSGVTCASVLTLFVVPATYHLLARRTGSPHAVTRQLKALRDRR